MKIKKIIPGTILIILTSVLLYSFQFKLIQTSDSKDIIPTPGFPEEIMKIVTNSCYDCHTSNSQNKMASIAMDFLKWNEYKTSKKVNLLNKIYEEVSGRNMPPSKYLDKFPDKVLTEDQIKLLSEWAKEESQKLENGEN